MNHFHLLVVDEYYCLLPVITVQESYTKILIFNPVILCKFAK